jgi:hypothetical protein
LQSSGPGARKARGAVSGPGSGTTGGRVFKSSTAKNKAELQPRRASDCKFALVNHLLSTATNLFPIWVLLGGALALVCPQWFAWFSGDFITWGLAGIMLGMGITLSVDDFRAVLKTPRAVAVGFVAQYLIMPLLGWSIAHLLKLDPA